MPAENSRPTVVLVAFYNTKALGVRYLQAALERAQARREGRKGT